MLLLQTVNCRSRKCAEIWDAHHSHSNCGSPLLVVCKAPTKPNSRFILSISCSEPLAMVKVSSTYAKYLKILPLLEKRDTQSLKALSLCRLAAEVAIISPMERDCCFLIKCPQMKTCLFCNRTAIILATKSLSLGLLGKASLKEISKFFCKSSKTILLK